MPATAIPGRTPISAPRPGSPPGGGGGSFPGGGSSPRPGLPPAPSSPPTAVPPINPPSGFKPPVPAPALPQLRPPAIPVPAVPAPVGARPPIGGAGLGLGLALAFELVFPPPVGAPEAPGGVDPGISPLQQPPNAYPPVTAPPNGLFPDGTYRVECNYSILTKANGNVAFGQNAPQASGTNVPTTMRSLSNLYSQENQFTKSTVLSFNIVLVTPGIQPLIKPNYPDFQNPIGSNPPLQQPLPIGTNGQPSPQYPPLPKPQPLPERLPPPKIAPPITQPLINPVTPPAPIVAPPILVPSDPAYPPPFTPPRIPPQKVPVLPGAPPVPDLLLVPPVEGEFIVPPPDLTQPVKVPPREPTQGADCCFYPDKGGGDCDLEPVLKKLKDIEDCVCIEGRQIATSQLGSGDSGSYSLPPESLRVILTITNLTPQVRSQSGNSQGQEIFFLGSYSFGTSSGYGDRRPISYMSNVFECPKMFDAFTFALNFGSEATVEVVYLQPLE